MVHISGGDGDVLLRLVGHCQLSNTVLTVVSNLSCLTQRVFLPLICGNAGVEQKQQACVQEQSKRSDSEKYDFEGNDTMLVQN